MEELILTDRNKDELAELVRYWFEAAKRQGEENGTLRRLMLQQESFILEHCAWEGLAAHQARQSLRTQMERVLAHQESSTPAQNSESRSATSQEE